MKIRGLTIALCFVPTLFVAGVLLAKSASDGPISGSASVTKQKSTVYAYASANSSPSTDEGWYWIHAIVDNVKPPAKTDSFSGQLSKSIDTQKKSVPKDKGYAYCSMWAQDGSSYHSILLDIKG